MGPLKLQVPGAESSLATVRAAADQWRRIGEAIESAAVDAPEFASKVGSTVDDIQRAAKNVGNAAKAHERAADAVHDLATVLAYILAVAAGVWASKLAYRTVSRYLWPSP